MATLLTQPQVSSWLNALFLPFGTSNSLFVSPYTQETSQEGVKVTGKGSSYI
jgi:hypothetical protein